MIRLQPHLLLLCLLVVDSGCRYAADYVTPTPDRPAPFSYKPAAVQLSEIYRSGLLREKYVYKNGRLAEQQYILINEKPYGINYYKRSEGTVNSLEYWFWPGIIGYESGEPGRLERQSTLVFQLPARDTLQEATISESNRVALVNYGINAEGYITSVRGLVRGGNWFFARNTQNNVIQAHYYNDQATGLHARTFEYDDHPNPFYAMGRMGDLALDTSPNNIIRSTTYSINTNGTILYTSSTTCSYTYRPDGYPEKAIIKNSDFDRSDTLTYKYNQ